MLTETPATSRIFTSNLSSQMTRMPDTVYFSLFKGIPDCPVTIFNQGRWTLENHLVLDTCIIGKSHRVTSLGGGVAITEFIACSPDEISGNSLDHFPLKAGESYTRKYQVDNLKYAVDIEMVPRLYENMEDFLGSMGKTSPLKILTHRFEPAELTPGASPFTGLAVDPAGNCFFTIHTYPENRSSIISKTRLQYTSGSQGSCSND